MAAVATCWLTTASPQIARAQLLSPGALARVHADLEGATNCTSCHTVGGRGVDAEKCLSCHETLRSRIAANTGFHADKEDGCDSCHRDHLGRDFQVIRLEEASFKHAETGYDLLGAHQKVECRNCHKPDFIAANDVLTAQKGVALDKTFLGLSQECSGCHAADEPHAGQFGDAKCADCHSSTKWSDLTSFSHAKTDFGLTGRHADLECSACHRPNVSLPGDSVVQYVGLAFGECSSCHVDPHKAAFGATCSGCHSTGGWTQITGAGRRSFDHAMTGFALVGAHARLDCAKCHKNPPRNDAIISVKLVPGSKPGPYAAIEREFCTSCHVDYHAGDFRLSVGKDCAQCHSDVSWTPTSFDIDRHSIETDFVLVGAHEATPCQACHLAAGSDRPHFRFEEAKCEDCHRSVNPHDSTFTVAAGTSDCGACHNPSSWKEQSFDHATTGFPLVGKHVSVTCVSCHPDRQYAAAKPECSSCHLDRNPHGDQFRFAADCQVCHDATGFTPVSTRFDHAKTRFPLDGAHRGAACVACHTSSTDAAGREFVRYVGTPTACRACHAEVQ